VEESNMSIYATGWQIKLEMHPPFSVAVGKDEIYNPYWAEVYVQYVPGHIGHPEGDYETDPYADYLPPVSDDPDKIRAAVIVLQGFHQKDRQRYVTPVMVLSREEYDSKTWDVMLGEIYHRIQDMLKEKLHNHPWTIKKDETGLQLALDALETSEKYIDALKQHVYARSVGPADQQLLDRLESIDWSLREKAIAEIRKRLNK
jgi:hypothetical protein